MQQSLFLSFGITCAFFCALIALIVGVVYTRPHKKANTSNCLADLLDYAQLTSKDTIILKNGALMRIYSVKLKSLSYKQDHEIEKLHYDISNVFKKLEGSYVLNFDLIREEHSNHKEPRSYFGPFNGRRLFLKRLSDFQRQNSFFSEYYFSITSLGQGLGTSYFSNLFLKEKQSIKDNTHNLIEEFEKTCDYVISAFSEAVEISLCTYTSTMLIARSHKAVSFLHKCITGSSMDLYYPENHCYLDAILATKDFYPSLCPKVGDKHIAVVAVDGLPQEAYFSILKCIGKLPFEYRFSTRFITFSNLESNIKLEFYKRLWTQKRRGIIASFLNSSSENVNEDAVEMIDNIKTAKKDLDQGQISFGSYCSNILIYDENIEVLEKKSEVCIKTLEKIGFSARLETVNATEAYLGSLPGHSIENLRRNIVSSEILTDLIPLDAPFQGERFSPNKNYGLNAPYLMAVHGFDYSKAYLNLHVQDLANCLVVGPPGTGKSVFLGSLITSLLRYEGMKVFTFDKGNSFYALTKALNGNHLTLDTAGTTKFCPLKDVSTPSLIANACDFVFSLYKEARFELDSYLQGQIKDSIELLATLDPQKHSLSDLASLIPTAILRNGIERYLRSFNKNSLLDGFDNPNMSKQLTVFECGQFFEKDNQLLYPTLTCIFNLINDEILNSPCSAIIIDEAWLMISNKEFCEQLLNWIKTVRKHNTVVILATQSVKDFSSSNLFEDLLDCIKTRFYLPNSDVLSPVLKETYQKLNLNNKQLLEISQGVPKQDIFMQKDSYFMPFRLALSEEELKLLSLTHKSKAKVDRLFSKFGDEFIWNL